MKRKKKQERQPSPSTMFNSALAAAEKRLAKALAERGAMQHKFALLNAEIPALQRTIAALKQQLGEQPAPPVEVSNLPTGVEIDQLPQAIPPEIVARLPIDDLSGQGSIPATTGEKPEPTPDDEEFYLRVGEN